LKNEFDEIQNLFLILKNNLTYLEAEYYVILKEKIDLKNNIIQLEDEYSNLSRAHSVLKSNYTHLEDECSALFQDKMDLEREFNNIINLNKTVFLEKNRSLEIDPSGSTILSYGTIYAGYVDVNFTSSTDIYFWIGSNVTENYYYARYPSFPSTATNGTFMVPICSTIYIYIKNPNTDIVAEIILTIKLIY